jgi:hypothetical protein
MPVWPKSHLAESPFGKKKSQNGQVHLPPLAIFLFTKFQNFQPFVIRPFVVNVFW